jgi:UDP-N-acetylmuramyl tripeptide synthase
MKTKPSLKTLLAIEAGKLTSTLTKTLKLGSGTSLPGKVARKLDANVLRYLGSQVTETVIAVTGTNGKTTTCGLLSSFLEASGKTVIHNQLGANMVPGITAAILNQSHGFGKIDAQCAVLEVDEASLKGVLQEFPAQMVVITNLFRDQLDRYGELDTTQKLIESGITDTCKTLVLNADDPLVYAIRGHFPEKQCVTFGVNEVVYGSQTDEDNATKEPHPDPIKNHPVPFPREVTNCPSCHHAFVLTHNTLGHLGHYDCPGCGFKRPEPVLLASRIQVEPTRSILSLSYQGEGYTLTLPLPGLFNAYNFLSAALVALQTGVSFEQMQAAVNTYAGVFGRAEHLTIQGKNVMVMLIKNPVGATEVLKLVASDPKARLMCALNANYADGRDVSWIWDAAFDVLEGMPVSQKPIVVSGERKEDLALRLQYAGIDSKNLILIEDLEQAVLNAVAKLETNETLYILPTYTVLLSLKNILPKLS